MPDSSCSNRATSATDHSTVAQENQPEQCEKAVNVLDEISDSARDFCRYWKRRALDAEIQKWRYR